MKLNILSICFILLIYSYPIFPKDNNLNKPKDNYEIKIGGEINRLVPSVGIGRNFYISDYISLSPELLLVGVPILEGTFRINIPATKYFKISPHAGYGFTPVGFLFSGVGTIGVNISYNINEKINIFIEPRIYYYNDKVISVGSKLLKIDDINKTPPFIVTIGIGL